MSAIYFDVPGPASKLLKALPLKYTEAEEVYGEREIDDHVRVLIFGQPFSYEWAIQRDGKIEAHSDCGYGIADVALIDGLTAYYKPAGSVRSKRRWPMPSRADTPRCPCGRTTPHGIIPQEDCKAEHCLFPSETAPSPKPDPIADLCEKIKQDIRYCDHGYIHITCGACVAPWLRS